MNNLNNIYRNNSQKSFPTDYQQKQQPSLIPSDISTTIEDHNPNTIDLTATKQFSTECIQDNIRLTTSPPPKPLNNLSQLSENFLQNNTQPFPTLPPLTQNQKQQQLKTAFELAGGANTWVDTIQRECIEGSAISPNLVTLNITFIEDTGRWEVNDWLGQDISRWYEGNEETGEWNRYRNHNYWAGAFFTSENGQIFNAKVANPKEEFKLKPSLGFGHTEPSHNISEEETFETTTSENPTASQTKWLPTGKLRRYEAVQNGGNRIFYPSLDRETRILINMQFGCNMPLTGDVWPWLLAHPQIPIGITEGAKKSLALCSQGFLCLAVLGIANWSIPKTKDPETGLTDPHEARILMPELVELARGNRLIPVWYDQDDPKTKLKAFINAKYEGNLLITALKAAGASRKTALMWWPAHLGKGIDDVIVKLLKQEIKVPLTNTNELQIMRSVTVTEWIEETIATSKNASIYNQIERLYAISPDRLIESITKGGYLSDHLDLKLEQGKIHAIIAGTGAGKTTLIRGQIEAWIKAGGFVLVITPTNNLGKQLAENVRLPHRHDYATEDLLQLKAQADGGFVCCIDSLPKLEKYLPTEMPILVICEEADQVANHATIGHTLKGKYAAAQESLTRVLTQAKAVILAEARIPENTLRYTEQLSGKPTRVFIHELEINKRHVTCYSGQVSGFEALFLQRLRNGERILLTSDSQRQLEKLERLVQQEMPHIKTMRNDHNTAYLPETKELTISPNQVLAREQLQVLFYSPGSKSGWDLTGQDNQGNQYKFDRVMAIFRVLPTSDHIQMIARYRPDCPWDIYLSETIQVTGDETNGNPRKLSRQMEEEAKTIALGWNIPYDPSNRPPLEKFARDHYVVATARAGLEKRINYYSMVQRLIEDGHTVTEEKLDYHKKMADRMRLITSEIEREWADLIASIKLSLTDTIELAKKLEQLEAPNPEQRAKAERILLVTQHPGIDFDHPEICYQTTRSHKSLVRGVDLEAATHNIQAVAKNQKKATTEHFEQSIIAVHHLPHKADRAYLMLDCGILEMLTSGKIFSSSSPEVLELMRKILAKAKDWKRYFSFNFTPDQPPISFLTRAARCLAIKFHTSRPGTKDRPRQYQVYTTQLIDQLIAEGMEKLDEVRSRYANKTESELDRIVEDKSRAARLKFFRQYGRPMEGFDSEEIFNEVISLERVDPLAILTADHHEQIEKLLDLRNQVKTRTSLLQAVLDKYLAATSTISINGDSYIEKVDEKEQSQKTTQKTVLSLLDFANS